MNSMTFFCS